MEVVGFAAAIVTLTKVTTMAISAISFYSSALKNGSEFEIPKVIREIEGLQAVLKSLELLAQKAECKEYGTENALPTLKAMCVPHKGTLTLCLKELENLNSRLSLGSQDRSKRRKLVQQLRWPLKKKETEQLILNIRRYTECLVQAMQADQASITLDMKNRMQGQNFGLALQSESLHRKIDQWLSAANPLSNYLNAKRKRHPNTALWFIKSDQFVEWKSHTPSFCWLHGILGSGKTVMSSVIVEQIQNSLDGLSNPTLALAYFYFDFSDPDKITPESMTRSLIKQLCHQCRDLPQGLISLYETSQKRNHEPEASELGTALRNFIERFGECFIVLDALDECSDVTGLLHIIGDILRNMSVKVHFLTTSRQAQNIENGVDSLPGKVQKVPMNKTLVNGDICTFVHECLRTDARFKRWASYPDIQKDIENQTANKSDGMFQWAVCQLEVLRNCAHTATVHEALASPPESLNAIYERILRDIDLKWKKYAPKILQWLAFSARPLTIAELAEMFMINVDDYPHFDPERRLFDPREILDMCSPLVIIDVAEGGGEVVRLAHLSVKEFILSNYPSSGPLSHYHISENSANVEMAEICLAYLLHFGQKTVVNDGAVTEFPLARYASRYWTHHVRAANTSTIIIRTFATKLLSSPSLAYFSWIRLYDPERPTREPNYNRKQRTICAPLYYMALTGLAYLTELLLEDGINPDIHGGIHGSPLQAASAMGHVQVAEQLLARGADINLRRGGYGNPLRLATIGGHTDIVELLLRKGADITISDPLLQEAATRGHIDIVKLLLRNGQNPNTQDDDDGTALQGACTYGHDQVVQVLLESGADVNIQGGFYGNPLQAASAKGDLYICTQLLSKGADPNSKGGRWCSALKAASAKGHLDIVKELLKNGGIIDIVDGEGGISLQTALAGGHESVSQLLLSKGANPSWKGGKYGNVLQAASLGGVLSVVKFIIDKGVDVNTSGGKLGTALQAASSKGHVEIIEYLIDHGALVNIRGGHYGSALLAASSKGHEEVVQILLTHGANLNIMVGKFGFAIQEAAVHNHPRVVQLLLDNGADLNSSGGRRGPINVLELVARRGHIEVVRVILQWAADTHFQLVALEAARKGALECGRHEITTLLNR
ncbi:hypothetical protein EMCG_06118 [[Emmonsia] crescens]|uniref:Uncharacterized protein n=1 Tax=[Emmonsia] crescens TaxID=73230 RepID=A0A0G2IC39_9EURO|nr:hypothetical protein EMCG_06118 [Emmonsia crescens UAMH 3008]